MQNQFHPVTIGSVLFLIFRYSLIIHALYRLRARTAIRKSIWPCDRRDSIVSSLRFSPRPFRFFFFFDTIFIVHRHADLVSTAAYRRTIRGNADRIYL